MACGKLCSGFYLHFNFVVSHTSSKDQNNSVEWMVQTPYFGQKSKLKKGHKHGIT